MAKNSNAKEKNYEFRRALNTVHLADRRDFDVRPERDEILIEDGWRIVIGKGAPQLVVNVAKDLLDYFLTSMHVSVAIKRESPLSGFVNTGRNCIVLATKEELPDAGSGLSVERSYRLMCSPGRVIICGNDDCGVAQGCYYIEDLMNLREAPVLKKSDVTRRPIFSPRMTHSGWGIDQFPDAHLNAVAHAGMDSIILFVKGVDQTTRGYLDFGDLASRAKSFGLDVYFYSYLKSLRHPDEPDAQSYYEDTYGALFKACPGAKGVILVGESCEFPSKDPHATQKLRSDIPADGILPGKPSPGWWPCCDYPQWLDMIKKAVRAYNPDADIVFWTYNWGWAPEEDRLNLLRSLPNDVTLLVTFEMFEQIRHHGITHVCVDYTISFAGPGEYFISEAKAAHEKGLRLYAMSNTGGLTWDFGVIPYVPVPFQWARRYRALLDAREKWGLSGIMESHHYGWWPSFISELTKWAYWSPGISAEEALERIAHRDFGSKGAALALKALKEWSEAICDYVPTNEDQYGPFRVGPSYPLVFHPNLSRTFSSKEISIPAAPYAHFGSLIVRTLYEPYESARQSPGPMRVDVEIDALKTMMARWQRGVGYLEKAAEKAPENKRAACERLLGLGRFILNSMLTTINVKKWWKLNQELMGERDPDRMHGILDKLVKIAEGEIANARETILLVEMDSRLGWEPSMEYVTDPSRLEWKIRQVRTVLESEIPEYRKAIDLAGKPAADQRNSLS